MALEGGGGVEKKASEKGFWKDRWGDRMRCAGRVRESAESAQGKLAG